MKTSKFTSKHGIELEYIFQKSSCGSKALIVAFPGPAGGMRGGEWGYLVTIRKISDVNVLFLRSNSEYNKSRMTFRDGKPVIDQAIAALVEKISREVGVEKVIAIGTSMGGYAAMYFGLKYDWDIISGSPSYTFNNSPLKDAAYAIGEQGAGARDKMNQFLPIVMESAGQRKYRKKCSIFWGEGEVNWLKDSEGPQLIKDMEKYQVNCEYRLYPFADHQTVCELFPLVLEANLNYYLGLVDKPQDMEEIMVSPKAKMYGDIKKAYKNILEQVDIDEWVKPNLNISNNIIFGSTDEKIALRNYVYIKEGWLWDVENYDGKKWTGFADPIKIEGFWDFKKLRANRYILSFYFQSTLLYWFKGQHDKEILQWLLGNSFDYINTVEEFPKVYMEPYDFLIHILYFIELHKECKEKLSELEEQQIAREIGKSLKFMAEKGDMPVSIRWQYKLVLGLLTTAVYYRKSRYYNIIYAAALEVLNALNEYHFDKNGCCISGQLDSQDYLFGELRRVMNFIEVNGMESNKSFQKAKRIFCRVEKFTAHIRQPNNIMPALGHTANLELCRSRRIVSRAAGCYIKRTSNIAFLEDEKAISYITIHGGSNTHSNNKHCDLLSFTWNYDGAQVFYDAGGIGWKHDLENYANSCVAHSAFICDEIDYVTPEYDDWTAIDVNIVEEKKYIIIPTSHYLIEGVSMKRKFFWLKPNILILIDEGNADTDRRFAQNFLLGDFHIDRKDLAHVFLQVSHDIEGHIIQHFCKEDIELDEYRGVNELGEDVMPRGTIIDSWRNPRRGLNLTYSKRGKEARFVTSIELHSGRRTGEELSLQSVNFDIEGNLILVLGDGEVIYEKC